MFLGKKEIVYITGFWYSFNKGKKLSFTPIGHTSGLGLGLVDMHAWLLEMRYAWETMQTKEKLITPCQNTS